MPRPKPEAVVEEAPEPAAAPAPPAEPEPPPAPRRAVEHWAAVKGMLPEFLAPASTTFRGQPLGTNRNPEFVKFAAARGFCAWVHGAEVTEAEFDAAVEFSINGAVIR